MVWKAILCFKRSYAHVVLWWLVLVMSGCGKRGHETMISADYSVCMYCPKIPKALWTKQTCWVILWWWKKYLGTFKKNCKISKQRQVIKTGCHFLQQKLHTQSIKSWLTVNLALCRHKFVDVLSQWEQGLLGSEMWWYMCWVLTRKFVDLRVEK